MQSAGQRASKRQAPEGPETPTSRADRQPRLQASALLLALPSELERCILSLLHSADLASLACTCGALRESAEDCGLWRLEWERVYGEAGPLQDAAAARAGGWKRLFASRHAALKEADPWLKPSAFEVDASVHALVALPAAPAEGVPPDSAPPAASAQAVAPAAAAAVQEGQAQEGEQAEQEGEIQAAPVAEGEEPELCLVFLVDGSGSVTEEDFRVMTDFMTGAVRELAAAPHGPRSRVAVVQFSNDVRVEQGPVAVDVAQFETLMGNMHRMNGGTNIALAVQKAGQLLKPLGPRTHRVLALLTDGRIDSHQSREAADMASRLGDEQACVRLHAYGVGRGVDREELLRIIGGREPQTAEHRYLGLMVLDEAPW